MISRPGVDVSELAEDLLALLKRAESLAGFEFELTSGYRAGDQRCHGVRKAVDISVDGGWRRMKVVECCLAAGFRRIGVYDRHVHVDVCKGGRFSQDVLWIGVSK